MRRGFMAWNPAELPEATLSARTGRLQAEMRRQGLDAFIIYTNFPRPSAVCHLTAFTPYWSDALLFVPREGRPVFATALSKRVANWIRSVMPQAEIVNSPVPGTILGRMIAEGGHVKRAGVLELDALPGGLYDEIEAAAPGIELIDGSACFAAARGVVDDAEAGLLARADTLARDALACVEAIHGGSVGDLVGAVERHARLGGAEEAYIHIAPDLAADARLVRMSGDGAVAARFAVRASVAYKGAWVRRVRTFARDAGALSAITQADAWLADTVHGLTHTAPLEAQIARAAASKFNDSQVQWTAESQVGSYPLELIARSGDGSSVMPRADSLIVLTVSASLSGGAWIGARTGILGRPPLSD